MLLHQLLYQWLKVFKLQHVRTIRESLVRIRMHLEEVSVGTESLGSKCHCRNKPAIAGSTSIATSRTLNAMRTIHYHARSYIKHVRDIAEINDEIVVAEAVATLTEPYFWRGG